MKKLALECNFDMLRIVWAIIFGETLLSYGVYFNCGQSENWRHPLGYKIGQDC